jgi:putative spermidine/putrescine transport system substrate-binding protein
MNKHQSAEFALNAGDAARLNSWSALLDEQWNGRAALVDEPAISIFDAALAAQAAG